MTNYHPPPHTHHSHTHTHHIHSHTPHSHTPHSHTHHTLTHTHTHTHTDCVHSRGATDNDREQIKGMSGQPTKNNSADTTN